MSVAVAFAVAFLSLQFPWSLPAQQEDACRLLRTCRSGRIFAMDPLGGQMLVKGPSGEMFALFFDQTTVFAKVSTDVSAPAGPGRIMPEQVNAGDWICARTNGVSGEERAAEVLVAPRTDIEKQQKNALAEWLRSGAFGTAVKVSPDARSFILEYVAPGGGRDDLLVNVTDQTQVHVGDRVYVHGDVSRDGASINARWILLGGFQAVAGTIESIDALSETLRLRPLSGGGTIVVHIGPLALFPMNPGPCSERIETSDASPAGTLDFGDLQPGDSVVVIGTVVEPSQTMHGLALLLISAGQEQLCGMELNSVIGTRS